MLAKKTSKNQITLPKVVAGAFEDVSYFDVTREEDRIVLTPLRQSRADEVRSKLASMGLKRSDVDDAIAWARKSQD